MSLDHLLKFCAFTILAIACSMGGWSGAIASEGALRFIVAGSMLAGVLLLTVQVLYRGFSRGEMVWIAIGGVTMVITQTIALTMGTASPTINYSRLLTHLFQQSLVVGWLLFCLECDWRGSWFWRGMLLVGASVSIANLVLWSRSSFVFPFEGFGTGKNGLAAFSLLLLFFSLVAMLNLRSRWDRLYCAVVGLLSLILLAASFGRASIACFLVGAAFLPILPLLRQSRAASWACFALVGCMHYVVIYGFSDLGDNRYFQSLENSFLAASHSLHSGREQLWPYITTQIADHPWTGHGTNQDWRFEIDRFGQKYELSPHNLWLAILFQTGLLGLAGTIFFLATVWQASISRRATSGVAWLSAGFLLTVLLREASEVSLTQNTLQIGLGSWAAIGCGIATTMGQHSRNQVLDEDDALEDFD